MPRCYVLVCQNVDCKARGSERLLEELKRRLDGEDVEVKPYLCFGNCQEGPNIVLHPNHTWYSRVSEGDLDDIVNHIRGGEKVERIADKVDPSLAALIYQLLDAGIF